MHHQPGRPGSTPRKFLRTLAALALALVPNLPLPRAGQPNHPDSRPQSTLTAQTPQAEFAAPANPTEGFTVKLTVDLTHSEGEHQILEIPKVLSVILRRQDPANRERQNYSAFKMPDGSVPVLEATISLYSKEHPDWKDMTIGIPLAMLAKPEGEHKILLSFSGIRWSMYVDGELLDNDFPFGYPPWSQPNTWKVDPERVKEASLYFPCLAIEGKLPRPLNGSSIQYWTPAGHNSWVGDVATFFHQGRYHVFYLFDRRHHQSKFGQGAHYFEHLSTSDFKSWTEHEAATPLTEQWECIGTGTPFVFENRLCLSYGLHTERLYPDQATTLPAQLRYLEAHGRTGSFDRQYAGVPIGATYAISADGISRFEKTGIFFHPCRNPSIYTDPRGKLRMIANYGSKGIWESESPVGGWRCISRDFPPGGDCTFFFRWGNFDYIIGGFKNLWSKPADAPDSAYEDVVRRGLDFYDGSNVPAVTEIADGRFLMAAWIPIRGWGGNLLIRELVQLPDGRIGSKWMDEITPKTGTAHTLATRKDETSAFTTEDNSFMLTMRVNPTQAKKGKFGISFLAENGEQGSCELQICLDDLRAQFGPGSSKTFSRPEKSLREGGEPQKVGNYAIENLIGVDQPFTVRVIVKHDDKLGGSLIDAEIAGQRTMISYRGDLTVNKLIFHRQGIDLTSVQIMPLTQ